MAKAKQYDYEIRCDGLRVHTEATRAKAASACMVMAKSLPPCMRLEIVPVNPF